ncbi:MAG TPA: hypothetical protein VK501_27290 [Baekduia sp.]|uniref:hypothetical protein n=1 Tax=Baekduia sp. TaxID=2600305 RepID=UPI002C9F088D|nr:hypothetical protein [Baekduia sp.]HMJ37641.1 hypothetical protein [Baekduia sp.]
MRAGVAALALALAFVSLPAADASAAKLPFQCATANRWCTFVLSKSGRIHFDIAGFDLQNRYRVCVTPPSAKERCKTFGLRPNPTGANSSSVRFTTNFPHARHGRYRVRWVYEGRQLGKVLSFSA